MYPHSSNDYLVSNINKAFRGLYMTLEELELLEMFFNRKDILETNKKLEEEKSGR